VLQADQIDSGVNGGNVELELEVRQAAGSFMLSSSHQQFVNAHSINVAADRAIGYQLESG
jgi:hypothetical protein